MVTFFQSKECDSKLNVVALWHNDVPDPVLWVIWRHIVPISANVIFEYASNGALYFIERDRRVFCYKRTVALESISFENNYEDIGR
mmetsp:Transcript_35313/g.56344  ORF Transcript_35313/g.56344 Transcript_35313/m.56344 type:complete len:86 (-) Transcript_35313:2558-2815(-)